MTKNICAKLTKSEINMLKDCPGKRLLLDAIQSQKDKVSAYEIGIMAILAEEKGVPHCVIASQSELKAVYDFPRIMIIRSASKISRNYEKMSARLKEPGEVFGNKEVQEDRVVSCSILTDHIVVRDDAKNKKEGNTWELLKHTGVLFKMSSGYTLSVVAVDSDCGLLEFRRLDNRSIKKILSTDLFQEHYMFDANDIVSGKRYLEDPNEI